MFIKRYLGWIIIAIIAIIPLVIWFGMLPLNFRFGNLISTITSLGQLAALLGMALFAIALILGARLKIFDRLLFGLNRVYINHHRLGAVAFSLLLFHPLLSTVKYLNASLSIAVYLWFFDTNPALILGKVSLFLMIILLFLTFFVSLRYDIWKKSHKYLGVAFFFGSLHMFLIASDTSANLTLRYYMLALSGLAIISYLYHSILGRWLTKRYLYAVEKVEKINESVTAITLSPFKPNQKMNYSAGQFAFINFNDRSVSLEQHPFSIVSTPAENNLKFAIKNLGDYTKNVGHVSRGSLAKIEGPYGKFSYLNCSKPKQIWIAGGIGITPFFSLTTTLCTSSEINNYEVDLYYCTKTREEMIFLEQFIQLSATHKNFRVIDHCSVDRGIINAKIIAENSNGLSDKDILVCGPPIMMKNLRQQFITLGVKKNHIHTEEFSL